LLIAHTLGAAIDPARQAQASQASTEARDAQATALHTLHVCSVHLPPPQVLRTAGIRYRYQVKVKFFADARRRRGGQEASYAKRRSQKMLGAKRRAKLASWWGVWREGPTHHLLLQNPWQNRSRSGNLGTAGHWVLTHAGVSFISHLGGILNQTHI
jgi:hypothetical protein